jgi:hypothetical protein
MMKFHFTFFSLALVTTVQGASWNRSNNPEIFNPVIDSKVITKFSLLPLKATLRDDRLGWSETYWPSNKGGIAYRWNHPEPQPFAYRLYSRDELMTFSEGKLSELSPAELYDIALGDYSYTLTKKVLKEYSPKDLWWEGVCHGWALAASHYPEPDKSFVKNPDGIVVPFGASDVKALLSMHDAYNSKGFYVRVGDRCFAKGKVAGEELPQDGKVGTPSKWERERPGCQDVNAGTFHIILGTMIGIHSQGIVADVDRYNDVWNQPVTGYDSIIVSSEVVSESEKKKGISKKIRLMTTMTYGEELIFFDEEKARNGELGFVSKEPVTGTPSQMFSTKKYEYVLELNSREEIIGGEWISETRPDMLWLKKKDTEFQNKPFPLRGLRQIYRPVTR